MSYHKVGCDAAHLIKKAFNGKTLKTLCKGEGLGFCDEIPLRLIGELPAKKSPSLLVDVEDLKCFKSLCKGKTQDELFQILGIEVSTDLNGGKILNQYAWPYQAFSFSAAGIDEEKLLNGVTRINGNCNLIGSGLKNLGNVRAIGGNLTIPLFGKLEDLSGIRYIGGDIICDSESATDVAKKIEQIKLNPEYFHGIVRPCDSLSYKFTENIPMPEIMQKSSEVLRAWKALLK